MPVVLDNKLSIHFGEDKTKSIYPLRVIPFSNTAEAAVQRCSSEKVF